MSFLKLKKCFDDVLGVQISIPAGKKIKKRPPFSTRPVPDDLGNIENDAARANVKQSESSVVVCSYMIFLTQ